MASSSKHHASLGNYCEHPSTFWLIRTVTGTVPLCLMDILRLSVYNLVYNCDLLFCVNLKILFSFSYINLKLTGHRFYFMIWLTSLYLLRQKSYLTLTQSSGDVPCQILFFTCLDIHCTVHTRKLAIVFPLWLLSAKPLFIDKILSISNEYQRTEIICLS